MWRVSRFCAVTLEVNIWRRLQLPPFWIRCTYILSYGLLGAHELRLRCVEFVHAIAFSHAGKISSDPKRNKRTKDEWGDHFLVTQTIWGIKIYLTVLVHELEFRYSELEITNWDEKNAILANFIWVVIRKLREKYSLTSIENLTHELMSINTPKRKDKSSPFAIFSGAYYSSCVWYGENWKICFNITTNQDKDIHTPLLGRLLLLEKKKSGRSNLSRVQLTPRTVLHCLSGLNSYSSLHFILLVGLALYPNRNSKTKDE